MSTMLLLFSSAVTLCGAANLYVASQNIITSLSLTGTTGNLAFRQTYTNDGCGADPSWLTFDSQNRILYCFDNNVTNNSSISSYTARQDGRLTQVNRLDTPNGPVSGGLYGDAESRAVLVANYHSESIATYGTTADGILTRYQTFTFTMPAPGPNPVRQALPHPHQAILDPTARFIVTPDLGADVVRFFSFENGVDSLTEHEPLVVAPGSGPRHVAFWSPDGEESTVFMYVLAELVSEVTAYRVEYLEDGEIRFEQVFNISSVTGGVVRPENMAAEIMVSPDNKFLTVSNRNDKSLTTANGQSDSLVTFEPQADGSLRFVQIAAAGGLTPRHFSFNKAGDLVAVGLQGNSLVVILERDVATGLIGEVLAQVSAGTSPACVLWDE